MDALTDPEITRLLKVLTERTRASEQSVESFRPPQTGIIEQVAANWNHFVVGRRGVGKSMLLLNVEKLAREHGQPVAYIDLENLRDNPYPDVLIRLLIYLTRALDETLKGRGNRWQKRKARTGLRKLRSRLETLLNDPQEVAHNVEGKTARSSSRRAGARAAAEARKGGAALGVSAGAEAETSSSENRRTEATFVRTKLQGLQAEAVEFRALLKDASDAVRGNSALVILDDFYFIRKEDQPDVLAYLHQITKNLNIWLKIGAVEHRLNEFEEGDPPRGLQLNQDATKVSVDLTLRDFAHTREFLEAILSGICEEAQVDVDRLLTDTAKLRLVMASGGVPRDYLNLVQASVAQAARRTGEDSSRPRNRITAEDVSDAAPDFLKQKEDELSLDAGPDAERLRARLHDVLQFCLNHRKANVFSVEARFLTESVWGQDVAALADLRFFHRIGNLTVKSNDSQYVGTRYQGFALDLSAYSGRRVRTEEVDFWTPNGFQRARAVQFVYTPDISRALQQEAEKPPRKREPEPPPVTPGQRTFFEVEDDD